MATTRESYVVNEALLSALKSKKRAEVLSLLDKQVTINSTEQSTGRQYIHYAASGGLTEVAIKLLDLGAAVNNTDKDENTPLHLAVKEKHEVMVALLVSRGANLTTRNKSKSSPLLMAINDKQSRIVEMLLRFEQDISVTEWDWTVAGSRLESEERKIIEAFERQCMLIPGIKNCFVHCGTFYLKPNDHLGNDDLQIDLVADNIQSPFVFQCDRIQLEYTNIRRYLKKKEEFFSDLYECRTWGYKEQELKLRVTVNDFVPTRRQLKFISVDNSIGRIEPEYDLITDDQDNENTIVTVYISVSDGEYSNFTIATVEQKELIKVSKEAVVLKPTMSPGTEISIPENTFTKDSQLSVMVMDTEETNQEEEQCMIATDALFISTSDHVQPEKDVNMKLPIHTQVNTNKIMNDVIVMASKDDHPDSPDDWEMLEPTDLANTKSLCFMVNHFSVFVGVARSWTRKNADIEKIHKGLENTIARKKKVVFMVFTKPVEVDGSHSVAVQCISWKKSKPKIVEWESKGYSLVICSEPQICTTGSIFEIELNGNITELYHSKKLQLPFKAQRENIRVFNVIVVDEKNPPEGKIRIQSSEIKTFTEQLQEVESGCFGLKNNIKITDVKREHVELTDVFMCDLKLLSKDTGTCNSDNVREKYKKLFNGFKFQKELLKRPSETSNNQD